MTNSFKNNFTSFNKYRTQIISITRNAIFGKADNIERPIKPNGSNINENISLAIGLVKGNKPRTKLI
ncbi:MAG: hypothetical protein M5T52_03450 [Ignavibacteriaceae bacterium]|nr:hypothetical protein [Ignavibacteriaceae bacterium]